MKTLFLVLVLCICSIQLLISQEEVVDDGVVALNIPIRNSLTFNRFTINPTFSFVREQNKYISISNKREWTQFENAPLTYLASYSGRFGENIGAGLGVFQQNYGVLTTFGGILNFAYNARLQRDSNLTFGLNIGAYKSGLNDGEVVTNFIDPSLENIPENFILTVNPAINYGTGFFDFGVSLNNIVSYNFNSSALIEDNPEQAIQGHIMYTGYLSSRGFFDESKFSGLVKSEFRKDETIISGIAMLTVPKGIWAQIGYNTVYGASGGLGLNISPQIAIEYNFEKPFGDLTDFGSSHEISIAYRFKNTERYEYSSGDEVSSLISGNNNKRRRTAARKRKANNAKVVAEQKTKAETDAQAKLLAEQKAKTEADAQAKLLAEQQAKAEADAQAKLLAEQQVKAEADAQAKLLAEQQAKAEADAQAKLLAEQQAKAEADAQAKLLAEQQAKAEADAQAKLLAEQQAKAEADAQAKLLAEQQAKAEAEEQAKLLAEQQAKAEADAQVKLLAEQQAKAEANAQAKLLAEQQVKAETQATKETEVLDDAILNPTEKLGKEMLAITQQAEASKTTQNQLLKQFDEIVKIKDQDLKDLKEENDLSEQGLTVKPKPFKSITEENNNLNRIKDALETVIKNRNEEIKKLKDLYNENQEENIITLENVNLYYKKTIERLEQEQNKAIQAKNQLNTELKDINVSTEYERRRRIKRASFDNDDERYVQDRAALQNIKNNTVSSQEQLTQDDFDFGTKQSDNIQILKNINKEESGYYLVIAVHSDVSKRDDFLTKVVQSGEKNVNFFYDVNSSKYYIYHKKFDNIQDANQSLNAKGTNLYNQQMSIVKIEN
ncbi:type IX secretion system PorP/SprF family membrane protein [Lacinutrix venerupis]|uniref:PorP/SprF family type IX secretion system membrane protein n=1 Tax=Lacinutrix venerupis TaxID=1486034 RepID=UPI000EB50B66|nr:PorP/SprF family type IX secretion system membrane protein [Lacinutrix venerupis]RLJ67200.1 type IX secretion system PorP/SprF family membrane protein [Lacinutrix venerupis]